MNWEGDYSSRDIPGGVESTPVVGTIYTVKDDGTALNGAPRQLTRLDGAVYFVDWNPAKKRPEEGLA
jgi:hypothetical protein